MLKKGDRVRHPGLPDFGLGLVLADTRDGKARVFFVGAGERVFSLAPLERVEGKAAYHPLLENLALDGSDRAQSYRSLPRSIALFLREYEGGFYGELFSKNERTYKEKARDLCRKLLARDRIEKLVREGKAAEVSRDALRVIQETNLVFTNELIGLSAALKKPAAQTAFAEALFALLHGPEPQQKRFEAFCGVLEGIGAAKWTIATYFPFFFSPETEIFVKPMVTQNAAEVCAYEIGYGPGLTWNTYERIRTFAYYLREEIQELRPRDMIDVQSFIWCISPNRDETRAKKAARKNST